MLVAALALASRSAMATIAAVTGFTIGHSLTLVAGFMGFVPSASWFIPAIEATIAASIATTAIAGMLDRPAGWRQTCLVGVLHGYGFSMALGSILGRQSADLGPAIAAFTAGLEIGQLLLAGVVLSAMKIVAKTALPPTIVSRIALASIAAAGTILCLQRLPGLWAAWL